jgi:hypothetical protein
VRAVGVLEFPGEGVPLGGIEMVLAEEGSPPGKNPRMITRARDSQASRSMGTGGYRKGRWRPMAEAERSSEILGNQGDWWKYNELQSQTRLIYDWGVDSRANPGCRLAGTPFMSNMYANR